MSLLMCDTRPRILRGRAGQKNFTTKLPRTTLGTGLARTGTNTKKNLTKDSLALKNVCGRGPMKKANAALEEAMVATEARLAAASATRAKAAAARMAADATQRP